MPQFKEAFALRSSSSAIKPVATSRCVVFASRVLKCIGSVCLVKELANMRVHNMRVHVYVPAVSTVSSVS